jgi:hypothetical protein
MIKQNVIITICFVILSLFKIKCKQKKGLAQTNELLMLFFAYVLADYFWTSNESKEVNKNFYHLLKGLKVRKTKGSRLYLEPNHLNFMKKSFFKIKKYFST